MNVPFELTGLTPLLMHSDDVEQGDLLREWRKDSKNKNQSVPGDDRTPPWTWQTYCYSDGESVAIPSDVIMACVRKASTQIILKGNKSFKELSQNGMMINTEFADLLIPKKKLSMDFLYTVRDKPFNEQQEECGKAGFALFVKRVRMSKAKHIRVRPRFNSWKVTGTINVFSDDISKDILRRMFDIAGKVGIGDWRPGGSTPGAFGMFESKLMF